MAVAAGIAIAGIGASLWGSSKASKANKKAAKAQQEAFDLQAAMKRGAVKAQTDSLVASKTEAQDKAVAEMSEMTRQAMIARGRLAASAGEAGVAGGSIATLFMNSFYEEARARGQQLYNFDKFNLQVNRDIRGVQSGLQIGARPAGYNSTGDAIQFVSSALSIAGNYYANRPASTTTTTTQTPVAIPTNNPTVTSR